MTYVQQNLTPRPARGPDLYGSAAGKESDGPPGAWSPPLPLLLILHPPSAGSAPGAAVVGPRYTAAGALVRPADVERWILVGRSTGLGYSEAGAGGAGPGACHAAQLEPSAFENWRSWGGSPRAPCSR